MDVEQAIIKLCCLEQNGYIGKGGRLGSQADQLGGCSIDQVKDTGGLEQGFGSGDAEELDGFQKFRGWTRRMEGFGQQDEKSCPFANMMSPGKWSRLTGE